mgnify:FL=1
MEQLTITLTGRRPVRIKKAEWPIIAAADWHDGEVRWQADRVWRLTVRQHADGRAIVYGVHETAVQTEHDRRGGELLPPGADIPAAVYRVAENLGFDRWLAERVIADLPAEEL